MSNLDRGGRRVRSATRRTIANSLSTSRRSQSPRRSRRDTKRLQQVLKNLLIDAFKSRRGQRPVQGLRRTSAVVRPITRCSISPPWWRSRFPPTPASAFAGKAAIIFEASSRPTPAPAANTAARAWPRQISREIAKSVWRRNPIAQHAGQSSTFTLYVPSQNMSARRLPRVSRGCPRRWSRRASDYSVPVERAAEQIPDDRLEISPGDSIFADRRGCPTMRGSSWYLARSRSFKVLVATRGVMRSNLPSSSSRAPCRSACSWPTCWAGRFEPAQAESADPAYSGADHHARRRPPACAGARRILIRHRADDDGRRRCRDHPDQGIRQAASASGCWSSRTSPAEH